MSNGRIMTFSIVFVATTILHGSTSVLKGPHKSYKSKSIWSWIASKCRVYWREKARGSYMLQVCKLDEEDDALELAWKCGKENEICFEFVDLGFYGSGFDGGSCFRCHFLIAGIARFRHNVQIICFGWWTIQIVEGSPIHITELMVFDRGGHRMKFLNIHKLRD